MSLLSNSLKTTGVPSQEQIESVFPCEERLRKSPVAVIECFESIPCDPCSFACQRGAILPFEDINDMPKIHFDKCNGCGLCIMKCPGLAIMVVGVKEEMAIIKIPYEFRPLPIVGQTVTALDRTGEPVCAALVENVIVPANKAAVVTISFEKNFIKQVRNINLKEPYENIVCRCSDITLNAIRNLFKEGFTDIEEIKRNTRLGMGPCQGRTCIPIVMRELSQYLNKPIDELMPASYRPIVKGIKLKDIAEINL